MMRAGDAARDRGRGGVGVEKQKREGG
jgi:hypothetical protein